MKNNINNAIEWLKNIHTSEYNVRGCITGSCMLEYFEGQDVDLFVYDESSLRNVFYAMYFNNMFQILDPLEKWKFEEYDDRFSSSGHLPKRDFVLKCLFDFNLFECFDDVASAYVMIIFDADTTFKVYTYFFHVFLETFDSVEFTGEDYNSIADEV